MSFEKITFLLFAGIGAGVCTIAVLELLRFSFIWIREAIADYMYPAPERRYSTLSYIPLKQLIISAVVTQHVMTKYQKAPRLNVYLSDPLYLFTPKRRTVVFMKGLVKVNR